VRSVCVLIGVVLCAGGAFCQSSSPSSPIAGSPNSDGLPSSPHIQGVGLVVGINGYQPEAGLWPLKHAVSDASDFARSLTAQGYHVETVLDTDATTAKIRARLRAMIELARSNHVVFVLYFAGHGGETADHVQYLAAYTTDTSQLEQTGLPLREILGTLSQAGGEAKVVLIDACRVPPPPSGSSRSLPQPRGFKTFTELPRATGVYLVNAAAPGYQSYEEDGDIQHGVFTYYLLKGFGVAAADDSGRITMNKLFTYVHDQVKDFSAKRGRVQEPTKSELDIAGGDVVLGRRQSEVLAGVNLQPVAAPIQALLNMSPAVANAPDLQAIHQTRYRAWQEMRYDDALRAADELVTKLPDDPAQRAARGWIEFFHQDFAAADGDSAYLVAKNASNDDWLYLRAVTLLNEKRMPEAKTDLDTILRRNSDYTAAYYTRALMEFSLVQADAVIRDTTEFASRAGPQADVFYMRGSAYYSLGNADSAIADFNTVIELQPANYMAFSSRGDLRINKADLTGAAADFNEAIRLAPTYAGGYYGRARVRAFGGQFPDALLDASKAVDLLPNFPANYILRAQIETALGQSDNAAKDMKTAQNLSAGLPAPGK
jgi:tetratricopeptide (TPR) repeat protein